MFLENVHADICTGKTTPPLCACSSFLSFSPPQRHKSTRRCVPTQSALLFSPATPLRPASCKSSTANWTSQRHTAARSQHPPPSVYQANADSLWHMHRRFDSLLLHFVLSCLVSVWAHNQCVGFLTFHRGIKPDCKGVEWSDRLAQQRFRKTFSSHDDKNYGDLHHLNWDNVPHVTSFHKRS